MQRLYLKFYFLDFSPSKSDNGVIILAHCGNMKDFLMKNQMKYQYGPQVSMAELYILNVTNCNTEFLNIP